MKAEIINGNLLHQDVEVIVNAWNRNIIPWWLLLPQGVSGAIKKTAGLQPFREIGRYGPMPLGSARMTSAGKLPFKGIIHVAGINILWRASEASIASSVRNAMDLAAQHQTQSLAFPIIGSGSGGKKIDWALNIMQKTLAAIDYPIQTRIVRYAQSK